MTTYTIDTENNITAFATKQEAGEGETFSTQHELADVAATWPANRLVEVWKSIPGLTPVRKFTDRKSAVSRIWKAIQSLDAGSPADAAARAPKRAKETKQAPKGKAAKAARRKRIKGGGKPAPAREASKKTEVLSLLQRKGGATLAQIMKATGWQAHSVRGFISGALGKKMGLTVDSVRREDGERVYSIA
jgi:hypothetical protein